jgi:ribose transport system ATP-binding protein
MAYSDGQSFESRLEVRGISKTFGEQLALADVSMKFRAGSVTAVLGHNGSGKSTMIKILAGYYRPDPGGEVLMNGEPVPLPIDPVTAHARGLRFVHQDLGLVGPLTIADNFAFASQFDAQTVLGPIRSKRDRQRVRRVLERLSIDVSPNMTVDSLDTTTTTMVAIARAVQDDTQVTDAEGGLVLVLDEPTAALPLEEVDRVLLLARRIADEGGSVIYVTHRIDEVLRLADSLIVLRDGRCGPAQDVAGLNADAIVELVAGGEMPPPTAPKVSVGGTAGPKPRTDGALLELEDVSALRLRGVSLTVGRGEIVGIGGLMGCGRSELARVVAGAQGFADGAIRMDGAEYAPKSSAEAINRGVSYVPQDRRGMGCIPGMTLQENLSLGTLKEFSRYGWLRLGRERAAAMQTIKRFNILPPEPGRLMANLSGGNQQKAVIAKALSVEPKLLMLDDPMQGVDVATKREIAKLLQELASEGLGILIGSTDTEDFVDLCDRVIVLSRGRVAGELGAEEISSEHLVRLAAVPELLSKVED